MHDKEAEKYLAKFELAKNSRQNFVDVFEECYEYALPQRESFYYETSGQRRDDKIFDETAVVGVQEFASRLQAGLVPNFARWADLTAGSEIDPSQKDAVENELDEITEYIFEILQNSNFGQEVHESFMDLAVGTGVLCVEEGDAVNPIVFRAVPLPHVVLDTGPDDRVDHVYRERSTVKNMHIPIMYPDAEPDQRVLQRIQRDPDAKCKLLEVVCRNYASPNVEAYDHFVIDVSSKTMITQNYFEGVGSNPYVCFRWSTCAGEVYGRGPLFQALSAIKTTNAIVRMTLENAQMAISGIYQMDDDGIINPDTINLVPGTIIPKSPQSAGLQPIQAAGRFDIGDLVLSDQRFNIKQALYSEMLGDPNKTPKSATEVAERMADLSRRIGSSFGRLQAELVQPVLQRVVYILKKQGRIEMPTVNGREVKVRSVSPLAQAQSNQDIQAISRFLETINGYFGQDVTNLLISSEDTAMYLAAKFGIPESLIRDEEERNNLVAMMQQMQQQQQMEQPIAAE
jgi:hypothetical protein